MLEIFDLDLTTLGDTIHRFHPYNHPSIVFANNTYQPAPIECEGFEVTSRGLPNPKIIVSNVLSVMGGLIRNFDGLQGAKLTRTKLRSPNSQLPTPNFTVADVLGIPDIYIVDRPTNHTRLTVTFELRSIFDLSGLKLPRRTILQSVCPYVYKSAECGYTGSLPTCNRDVDDCFDHFEQLTGDANPTLNFGGFPGVDRYNQ
jgi:lambda family phage minor tail protein L